MAISINTAGQNAGADPILTGVEGGSFNLYGGTPPADAQATQSNNVLATGTVPNFDPHSGDSGADMAAAAELVGQAAAGAGTAVTHFRLVGGSITIQGTVGAVDSGADIELVNVSVAEDQEVTITALNFTLPKATA